MCLTLVRGHQTYLKGPKEYRVFPHAQSTAGKSQLLQQTTKQKNNPGFRPTHLSFLSVSLTQNRLDQEYRACVNVTYPHRTAVLGAGCILLCTCRLWWSGRWEDTAGNSLHCYYCKDWCLGTQKHGNKMHKTNQRGVAET